MIDVRYTNKAESKDILSSIKKIKKKYRGIKVIQILNEPSVVFSDKNKYVKSFVNLIPQKYKDKKTYISLDFQHHLYENHKQYLLYAETYLYFLKTYF